MTSRKTAAKDTYALNSLKIAACCFVLLWCYDKNSQFFKKSQILEKTFHVMNLTCFHQHFNLVNVTRENLERRLMTSLTQHHHVKQGKRA